MTVSQWQRMTPMEQLLYTKAQPDYPMYITIVFSVARNFDYAWLSRHVTPRLLSHPRFCSRVHILSQGKFRFEPMPDFTPQSEAVRKHVVIQPEVDIGLPFAERRQKFSQSLDHILSTQLDDHRPLWMMHVFPKYSGAQENNPSQEDCSTVVVRVHHCISDGIGLLKFFVACVIDDTPSQYSQLSDIPKSLTNSATQKYNVSSETNSGGSINGSSVKISQKQSPSWPVFIYQSFIDILRSSLWLFVPDVPNPFNRGPIQKEKGCAIAPSTTFSVDRLKKAAGKLGVTLNDILFTAVSAGTAEYFRLVGTVPESLSLVRCAIPMNRHMFDDFSVEDVSNQIVFVSVPLHVDITDLRSRLAACSSTMQRVKRGIQPFVSFILIKVLSTFPLFIRDPVWKHVRAAGTLLLTNVPGPRKKVSICGATVDDMYFFAPNDGSCGVSVSLLSYAGGVCLGVLADKSRVQYPERLIDLIQQNVERILGFAEESLCSQTAL